MELMSDTDLLKGYKENILSNRKNKTVKMYMFLLNNFIDYLHEQNKTIHLLTVSDIQSYLRYKEEWKSVTKRHFIVILKSFLSKYYINKVPVGATTNEIRYKLQRENDIKEIYSYPLPRIITVSKQKTIDFNRVKILLDAVRERNVVDYCIMYVLFYFGFRKSELVYLSPKQDINWKENCITITAEKSKTHTERTIYFNDFVRSLLVRIVKEYGTELKLINKEDTYINKIFRRYDKVMGMHLFPHMCRHTFVTEMQKSCRGKTELDEVTVVKILAGHNVKSMDMTSYYTDYTKDLKNAMLKYHYLLLLI